MRPSQRLCTVFVLCLGMIAAESATLHAQTPLKKPLSEKMLLIPGQSAGPIQLGMTRQEVYALLKKPDTSYIPRFAPHNQKYRIEHWMVNSSNENTDEEYDYMSPQLKITYAIATNRVIQIEFQGNFQSSDGITDKTRLVEFCRKYPKYLLKSCLYGDKIQIDQEMEEGLSYSRFIAKDVGISVDIMFENQMSYSFITRRTRHIVIHPRNVVPLPLHDHIKCTNVDCGIISPKFKDVHYLSNF